MKSKYDSLSREQLIDKIQKLEKERYGLAWEDKEVDVAKRCEAELPLLKEDCKREIVCDPTLPYNIIIEGDNYHSLYALNFTHKKSIDVIYIDPPYNTGNKDFIYNDSYVDKTDSTGWLHRPPLRSIKLKQAWLYTRLIVGSSIATIASHINTLTH